MGACSLLRALSGARPGGRAEGAGGFSPSPCRQTLRAPHFVEAELSPREVQAERTESPPAEHPGPVTQPQAPKGLELSGCGPLASPQAVFYGLTPTCWAQSRGLHMVTDAGPALGLAGGPAAQ